MREKIKILYLDTPIDPPGGGQKSLFEILRNLDTQKYEPLVFLANHSSFEEKLISNNISYQLVPKNKLFQELKKALPDIIHCNSATTRYTFLGVLYARARGIPFFWHVRVNLRTFLRDHMLYLLCTRVIAISASVRAKFLIKYKTLVIPNGVDTQKFNADIDNKSIRKELGIAQDALVIATVGRFETWKGQDHFIEAAGLIAKAIPNAVFLIVGDGTPELIETLKTKTRDFGLEEKVIFSGYRKDIEQVMSAMDILIHFSNKNEAFGRVIIEAMSLGKAVITTSLGAMKEIIDNGVNGILINHPTPETFANTCINLVNNKDLYEYIKKNARLKAINSFDSSKLIARITELYDKFTSGSLRRPQ